MLHFECCPRKRWRLTLVLHVEHLGVAKRKALNFKTRIWQCFDKLKTNWSTPLNNHPDHRYVVDQCCVVFLHVTWIYKQIEEDRQSHDCSTFKANLVWDLRCKGAALRHVRRLIFCQMLKLKLIRCNIYRLPHVCHMDRRFAMEVVYQVSFKDNM